MSSRNGRRSADLRNDSFMAWVINCDCGTVVRGETDDEIVENATQHAKEAHGMTITAEQVMAVAQPEPAPA